MEVSLLRSKRTRLDPGAFKLTFLSPQLLRNLIEVISGVLTEVAIQVTRKESFEGIVIENLDVRGVCVVIAQLACRVELAEPSSKPRFTLPVEIFLTALKQVQSHYTLEVNMASNDADILLLSLDTTSNPSDPSGGKVVAVTRMTTLHAASEQVDFDMMTYEYNIQIKKNDFYSIVKSAKDYSANHISMSIYERVVDNTQHILFCLSCKGASASSDYYFSSKVDQGVIKVAEEGPCDMQFENEHLKVHEQFNTGYILTFLKAMEHKMITLRLSPSKPLICIYGLGAEESFAMFVLGGKTAESD